MFSFIASNGSFAHVRLHYSELNNTFINNNNNDYYYY